MRRSKKTSKPRVTGLCAGNSPETGEFPAQMASNTENVSIWWRHHGPRCMLPTHYDSSSPGTRQQVIVLLKDNTRPKRLHGKFHRHLSTICTNNWPLLWTHKLHNNCIIHLCTCNDVGTRTIMKSHWIKKFFVNHWFIYWKLRINLKSRTV